MRTIRCENLETLIIICAGLTREGVAFEARTESLTIEITGY